MPDDLDDIRAELDAAEHVAAAEALPHLRAAAERLSGLIDESMAQAVLSEGASIRSAGASAGLSENAVGPRLARTRSLGAYANADGRVTATGVQRAQYDHENGEARVADDRKPLRFKPRRNT
ncbi:hypothetical protein [Luteipulveratus mongoliensis]|uniref:Uncharacterized protein n=1 Tax=Luteipulveratus mongoliensis TaxID=571913 RepID=A0A0K1JPL1_9MICO|nr:hypothetical protein [Luteipulveratus mongoliensis]AKU18533.1 hypothetical protein VV02_01240 [Luteipulveratus mongoliensis]